MINWQARSSKTHGHGNLVGYERYALRITRPGCEFEGNIDENIVKKLPTWYNHAAISGFGNVKEQTTEVNADVRNAREIPATEFKVEDKLLRHVEKFWAQNFTPKVVHAKPYKIHMYGPGGQFRPHLDTPEKDLVGTFLVGLGDSTKPSKPARFRIGENTYSATAKNWVAFYPDVPHEVQTITSGYRAVIAFKLFCSSEDANSGNRTVSTGKRSAGGLESVEEILRDMPLPVGLHLTHKYPKGIKQLSGFDAILFKAANDIPNAQARYLPVMLDVEVRNRWLDENGDDDGDSSSVRADVYPLTEAHLDYLLGDKSAIRRDEDIRWLDGLSNIPFFSTDGRPGTTWSKKKQDVDYTGNDCRGSDEYSIYLSYALIILPGSNKGKRKAPVGEKAVVKKAAVRTNRADSEDDETDLESEDDIADVPPVTKRKGKSGEGKVRAVKKTVAATTRKVAAKKGEQMAPAPEVTAAGAPLRRSTRKRKATKVAESSGESEQE